MRRVLPLVFLLGLGMSAAPLLSGCSRQGEGERCDLRNTPGGEGHTGGDCADDLVCNGSVCCPVGKSACGATAKVDTGAPEAALDTGSVVDTGTALDTSSETKTDAASEASDATDASDDAVDAAEAG